MLKNGYRTKIKNKRKQSAKKRRNATRTGMARMMSLYRRRIKWKFPWSVFTQWRARTQLSARHCGHTARRAATRCGQHKIARPYSSSCESSATWYPFYPWTFIAVYSPSFIVLCTSARTCRPPMHTCECLAPFAMRNMLTWRLCAAWLLRFFSALDFVDDFWTADNRKVIRQSMEFLSTHLLLLFTWFLLVLFVVETERNFQMVRYTKMINDLSEFFKKYPETGQPGQPLRTDEEYREVCFESVLSWCFSTSYRFFPTVFPYRILLSIVYRIIRLCHCLVLLLIMAWNIQKNVFLFLAFKHPIKLSSFKQLHFDIINLDIII